MVSENRKIEILFKKYLFEMYLIEYWEFKDINIVILRTLGFNLVI